MLSRETIVLFLLVVTSATISNATRVLQCKTGKAYEDPNLVRIGDCDRIPCVLRRQTTVEVEEKFTPETDIQSLTTVVHADILGLPVPFIGVNGVSACDRIFNADGSKAGCPLVQGKEYLYKNSFPILSIYPKLTTRVHWSLNDGKKDVTCFQVPARIV